MVTVQPGFADCRKGFHTRARLSKAFANFLLTCQRPNGGISTYPSETAFDADQEDLPRHFAEFDRWEDMSDAEREKEIKAELRRAS
jgi:hypothetical protein